MKKNLLLLALFVTVLKISAQNVSVYASAGLSAFGSYATLKQAFDSINTGFHAGSITINIVANTTETATAKLDSSGRVNAWGTSSYSNITIRPFGGAWTVSGAITAGSPLIDLNGADNVTIDGSGSAFSDSLTLVNTTASATSGTSTVRFINDASNNILRNLIIKGAATMSTTTNGGIIYFATAVSGGKGNDDNLLTQCVVTNSNATNTNFPYKMVFLNGTTTSAATANSGNVISNNRFVNFRANGVYANTGVSNLSITNNHFYHTASLASSSVVFAPIWVSNGTSGIGEQFNISGNYIGGTQPFCGGGKSTISLSTVFQVIYLNSATSGLSYINNNTIAAMEITSTSSTANHSYIFLNGGKIMCGSQGGNTIGSMTDTSSLIFNYSNSSNTNFTIIASAGTNTTPVFDTLWLENNMMGGITHKQLSTSGASLRAFDPTGSSGTMIVRNNTIGSPSVAQSIKFYGSGNNTFGLLSRNSGTSVHYFVSNKIVNIHNNSTGSGSSLTGVQVSSSWVIDSNTVKNLTASCPNTSIADAVITGIKARISSSSNISVSGNIVKNLYALHPSVQSNIIGIDIGGTPSGTANIVSGNRVSNLHMLTNATNGKIIGIRVSHATAGQPYTFANNEVIMGKDSSGTDILTGFDFYGIQRNTGNSNFYHNSVLVMGWGADSSANSWALYSDTGATCAFVNNVLSNERSYAIIGTRSNYAARYNGTLTSGILPGNTINYNLYYAPGAGGIVIGNSGNNYPYLSQWQSNAYTHDQNSVNNSPAFASFLRLEGGTGSAIAMGSTSLGITKDIDNRSRANFLIGAYDFDQQHPLPVKLISFKGRRLTAYVELNWSTASERNNSGFEVQRSYNGKEFVKAGFVKGNGTTGTSHDYSFFDHEALQNQLVFYRLKQLDHNNDFEYSDVIMLDNRNRSGDVQKEVFPNPFSKDIFLRITSIDQGTVTIEIHDLAGKLIIREEKELAEGENIISVQNLKELQSGLYYLTSIVNGERDTRKVMKE